MPDDGLNGRHGKVEQIGLADDTHEATAEIDDRKTGDPVVAEQLLGVLDRRVDRDDDRVDGHEVRDAEVGEVCGHHVGFSSWLGSASGPVRTMSTEQPACTRTLRATLPSSRRSS